MKIRTHVTVGTKLWSILLPHLSETERCYRCQQGKLLPTAIVSTKMESWECHILGMSEGQKKSRAKIVQIWRFGLRFRLLRQLRRLHISLSAVIVILGIKSLRPQNPAAIFQQHLRLYLTWFTFSCRCNCDNSSHSWDTLPRCWGPWCTGSCNRIMFAQTSCISGVVVGMMLDDVGCQSAWVRSYSMSSWVGRGEKRFPCCSWRRATLFDVLRYCNIL